MSWSDKMFKVLQLNFPNDVLELIPSDEAGVKSICVNGELTPMVWPCSEDDSSDSKEFWAIETNGMNSRSFAEEFIASLQFEINMFLNRWKIAENRDRLIDVVTGEDIEVQTLIIPTFF